MEEHNHDIVDEAVQEESVFDLVDSAPIIEEQSIPKKSYKRAFVIVAVLVLIATILVSSVVFIGKYIPENNLPFDDGIETPDDEPIMPPTTRPESGRLDVPKWSLQNRIEGEEMTIPEIYEQVSPSVVMILASKGETLSLGTGIIMSQDGYIITNAHIIEDCAEIEIVLNDNLSVYEAIVIGYDVASDLAVLKIEAKNLQPAVFGNSDYAVIGEGVVTIGNPYRVDYAQTVTDGIISGLRRNVDGSTTELIQTNAQLNPGNSGGPLINMYGQVIGINCSKIMKDDDSTYEGLGFAIPMAEAKIIVDDLIAYGKIQPKPVIGITVIYGKFHVTQGNILVEGCQIVEIDKQSDAYKKGLAVDDVIVEINGKKFNSTNGFINEKNQYKEGETVTLTYWRNGEYTTVQVALMPPQE